MELNQTSICYYEKKLAHISAATESADSIVPDTFPDIGRIVCAYGTAVIKDQTPQNDRLLVSGTVQTTVLYEPENGGKLRRLSVPVTFAHIEECEGLTAESICSTVCRIAAVDAEAMNSRKVSVSVQLCFLTEGYCKAECDVTESVELDGIRMPEPFAEHNAAGAGTQLSGDNTGRHTACGCSGAVPAAHRLHDAGIRVPRHAWQNHRER